MAFVPKKNISNRLHDIKHDGEKAHPTAKKSGNFLFLKKKQTTSGKKHLKYIVLSIILVFVIALGIYAISVKNSIKNSFEFIMYQAEILKESIFNTKTSDISSSINAINSEIQDISAKANNYGVVDLLKIIGQFNSSLKAVPGAFQNISSISQKSAQIAANIDYLKNNAIQLIFNQKGNELIGRLDALETDLASLEKLTTDFKSQAVKIKDLNSNLAAIYKNFDDNYLSIVLNIYKAKELVAALNSIVKSHDTNILLLFQNPTELRPGGGFIGSFGYITIDQGSIKEIKVDDIYNADRQLNVNVAPPKQLSAITSAWGARDANWFFDFSTSAQKVAYFLENSKLFSDSQTKFENVVAINTDFFKSIIEITGPIEIPQYEMTLNSENFLQELQYEVEAGEDKKPGQNPKKILSVLTPLLIDKIKNLDDNGKMRLINNIKTAVQQKNIMAFSVNGQTQKIFAEYGLAGKPFSIPKYFSGDYLAVINANVGAGKSDAFINQQILLQSQIAEDGTIYNTLSISRTHSGQNEKDWWYRSNNKNFMKIWLPHNAEILGVSGNNDSPYAYITPTKALTKDADLQNMESTYVYNEEYKIGEGEEYNKKSITTWITTPAGKSKELKINYKENRTLDIKDGMEFKFIFDKQSGAQGSLEYEIIAPPGYIWAESQNTKFSYGTQNPASQENIKLTLKKNNLL